MLFMPRSELSKENFIEMNMKKIINHTNPNADEWYEKTMQRLKYREKNNSYDVRCPRCGFLIRKGDFQLPKYR